MALVTSALDAIINFLSLNIIYSLSCSKPPAAIVNKRFHSPPVFLASFLCFFTQLSRQSSIFAYIENIFLT